MSTTSKRHHYDLPDDRPASLDESGHHVALNPADVSGRFRRYRMWFYWFLIAFFLALPWTRFAGHQTILLDLPNRRFAFFGLTFWAHDVPLLFFILGILTVGLAFVTAIWGRLWCGWGCPQTVFIDGVYRRIERWIEGNHIQRLKLSKGKWSFEKAWKKSLKWFLFWFVSTNIAHSFTAYFVGADRLLQMSVSAPWENPTPFIFVMALTAIVLFDFGWFREQFCMVMCPYGRFFSVLMDDDSLAVLYDEKRGEPRKGADTSQPLGDCINCYRCVAVCPTGIDIRRGVQMECIACTACIDACDEIMEKVDKPAGLIRYDSEAGMSGRSRRVMRPRVALYAAVLLILGFGFTAAVLSRQPLDAKFIRAVETPYTEKEMDDGSSEVVNHYRVNLKNQTFQVQTVALQVSSADTGRGVELVAPTYPLPLEGGEVTKNHIFFKFPDTLTHGSGKLSVKIQIVGKGEDGTEIVQEEIVSLVGPFS